MNKKDYQKELIDILLKKYNQRLAKQVSTNRRIIVQPKELYRKYENNDADILEKQSVDDAAKNLEKMEVVQIKYLRYSEDIEKIYLCEERVEILHNVLKEKYDITPQNDVLMQLEALLANNISGKELVRAYCHMIHRLMEDPRNQIDVRKVQNNLKMLRFLELNEESLYAREASMLVYGESKWFEDNNLDEICNIIRNILDIPKVEGERNDAILAKYLISPTEQEIFIKGDWQIEWGEYILETKTFQGGIAIASNDILNIRRIIVNAPILMTIENKTSYHRLAMDNVATLYLGGYATRYQVEFLKKVKNDNPDICYQHFGDIDVGGFWIHKHLYRMTSIAFQLFSMGVQQLKDKKYAHCLKPLTENDRNRLESLLLDENYKEVLSYMSTKKVKLEQEIVSYYLQKEQSENKGKYSNFPQ